MAVAPDALPGLAAHAGQLDQPVWVVGEVAEGVGVRVVL
jgi:hypothetical protein